jgi:aminoglycoside phosphotransferase (APT) family kinase protein
MAAVPRTRLEELRGYVSAVVGRPPASITAASRFHHGNRHAVYRVSYLVPGGVTKDLVVRVSLGSGPEDCAQAEREATVLKKVGGAAAPLLFDFRCSSTWFPTPTMCMQFIEGRQADLHTATPEGVVQVGGLVAWLHRHPAEGLADVMHETGDLSTYAEGRLESILSTMVWARHPLPADVQGGLRNAANSVQKDWDSTRDSFGVGGDGKLALLHGDIAPGNMLWRPAPVLIDWEYCRLGDPADEIAYLFDQNGLTPSRRKAFWHGYKQGFEGSQALFRRVVERTDRWEPLTLLGSALWWVERWVRRAEAESAGRSDPELPRRAAYYADKVRSRLDRLTSLLSGRSETTPK